MKTRILVVDDEPEFSSMLKANLESAGYFDVAEENDANRAVTTAREFAPDVILLDIMMPDLEGNEVAAKIREDPLLRDTPLFFLTALISELDAPKGSYTSGGNTFVTKSLPVDRLVQFIKDVINERRRAEKAARLRGEVTR